MSFGTKKMHWISALLTVLRLRRTGGLVENEVLEALKISLHPPSSPAAASPDLINRIRSFMSGEDRPTMRKEDIEYTRKTAQSPIAAGLRNCEFLLQKYENIHDPRDTGGYFVNEWALHVTGTWHVYTDHDPIIKRTLLDQSTDETERAAILRSNCDWLHYPIRLWASIQNVCDCPTPPPGRYENFGFRGNFTFVAGNGELRKCSQWALSYGIHRIQSSLRKSADCW